MTAKPGSGELSYDELKQLRQLALSLDDTLASLLPATDIPPGAAGVAVKHLLSHTGGIRGTDSVAFRPGSRFEYSNSGYNLLARILEARSGRAWYQHLASAVFAPAGMTATLRMVRDTPDASLPPGYDVRFDSLGLQFPRNPLVHTMPATGGMKLSLSRAR